MFMKQCNIVRFLWLAVIYYVQTSVYTFMSDFITSFLMIIPYVKMFFWNVFQNILHSWSIFESNCEFALAISKGCVTFML